LKVHEDPSRQPKADALVAFIERFGRCYGLSPQQLNLLHFAATGVARKESAARSGCSVKTVEEHWRRIYHKTGCASELQVVAILLRSILGLADWQLDRRVPGAARRELPDW